MSNQENEQVEQTNEQENEQKNQTQTEPVTAETSPGEPDTESAESKEPEDSKAEDTQTLLEQTQEELSKQKDRLVRTAAEYDNYRKRTDREKSMLYSDATAAAVMEFLPVADNLDRALAQKGCSADDLRKGVEMVLTQMQSALKKLGVTEMGAKGEPFNPDYHNAVSHIDDEAAGENTITQVFQKGYMIEDKVIRHAMVQVAN